MKILQLIKNHGRRTRLRFQNPALAIDRAVIGSKNDWLKDWKVIDLREVIKEIGGVHWDKHPVQKEWEYQIQERSKGNDRGNLELWLYTNLN
jgi:hypothetical protein